MMRRIYQSVLLLSFGLAGVPPAHALESLPVKTPHAEVTLVSEVDAVEAGKPFRLGLSFKLAKGWHIYWVNPGDAGEPPRLELVLPEGAKASAIEWPTPLRVPEGPVMTYSYVGEVLLPLTVTPSPNAAAFPIQATARWLICEKICVPEEGTFSLDLPIGAASPSPQAPLFAATEARLPRAAPFTAKISPDAKLSLAGSGISPQSMREAWFFPDTWGAIDDMGAQTLTVADGKALLSLKPAQTFDPTKPLTGVLVVKDAAGTENAFAMAAAPGAAALVTAPATRTLATAPAGEASPLSEPQADMGMIAMLVFAFLGGLLLNLMPCVFPILAVKAVGIAKLSGRERATVRAQGAFYTLGVLLTFAGLAALLLGLRAAGSAAGWGFQFQSPAFVAAMAWLLLLVGLNLSGVFEIGGGFAGVGGAHAAGGGRLGSFFTGLLAVLVATPCTAPFMGAAVAAAVTAPPTVTLLVFLAMGLGFALPYGLLALSPGLAELLPRPGAWTAILKQALAFPMYGASAWLVWIISRQTGSDGVFLTLTGAVLIGLAAWLFGITQMREGRARLLGRAVAAIACLAVIGVLYDVARAPPPKDSTYRAADGEQPYSASALARLRAEGRPVFVNMTAAWCVTCLVNERIALSSQAVRQAFARHNVAYLKGDWTRADPSISTFLREHGRDGVPLYVLYGTHGAAPVVLPQILTAGSLVEELDRLGS